MDPVLFYVGIAGNVITILMFASPIPTFWTIIRGRSTGDFEPARYVATLLNSSLWVYYGVTKPDGFLIATVNGVGVILHVIYVLVFLINTTPSQRVTTARFVGALNVGVFGAVLLITGLAIEEESSKIIVIGIMGALFNLYMYGAPLGELKLVIRTNSVQFMPFYPCLFLLLNGGIWTTYAFLARDIFIGIPNGIGIFLGAIQLVVYVVYMNQTIIEENQREHQQPLIV